MKLRAWPDAAVFAALAAATVAIYWSVWALRPLTGDNLYILWWAENSPIESLLRLDPHIYPEWRLLPYQAIWLEHQLFDLDGVAAHFAVNLAIFVTCAWLVYRVVSQLALSRFAGVVAAVIVTVDRRAIHSVLWIVERQTSMACAFGLLALWPIVRAADRRLARRETIAVSLLLLASALSKEYGLAFALALAAYAAWERRRDLAWPAIAGVCAYATLRVTLAGGAVAPVCDDMGYFFTTEQLCLEPMAVRSLAQMAYNVVASAIGIVLVGLFDENGMIQLDPIRLAISAVLKAPVVLALARGPRVLRLIALVPIVNALLSFSLYRDRNQVIGHAAMAILIGVGFHLWQPFAHHNRTVRVLRAIAVAGMVALLFRRSVHTQRIMADEVLDRLHSDPCEASIMGRPGGPEFATLIKKTYGLGGPPCVRVD